MPDYAGNTLLSAKEIGFVTWLQTFSDRVDAFGTDDYYRISLSGRSSLNLAVNGLSANANLQLLDRNGNTLQASTNSASISESINQILDPGVYYIRVCQSSSGADTNYTLNFKLQNSPKTDLYWRDYSSGANGVWFMGGTNNATMIGSTSLTTVAPNWHIEGITDFNGDNHPDLLWRDYSSGANGVWFMGGTNNATMIGSTSLTTVASNWHIEGIADFNGDNHPDLLWRDYSSGANGVWFMGGTNNATMIGSTSLTTVAPNWHIDGIADFNGDNHPDLLWRDYSSGANGVWFMGGTNNATMIGSTSLTTVAPNWQPLTYTRYEEPLPTDLAGNTTTTAFNAGTLSGNGVFSDRIDSTDPNDYYQFTLLSASNVSLLLNGLSANADLQLFSSTGTLIQGSYNSSSSAESISTALSAGTYYVRVYQSSGSTNYSLNLSATAASTNLYYFTYYYGNGDSYQGYGYTTDTSYYSGRYIYDTATNETGNKGYYNISSLYSGYSSSYNNQVYVYSYYNSETSTSYTPYSGSGSGGLGSEYGYVTNGDSNTYYGGKYYEADLGYQYYTFSYRYDNTGQGDYYAGYGYAEYGKYTSGQYLYDSVANETGYSGYYLITSLANYTTGTASLNSVYVSNYYNSETKTSYTPYSGSGSGGLGSEYGYVTNGDSNTYYGGKYYEADLGYQYYIFKYSYGSGQDYYTGYGYADYGKYTASQYLNDSSANETGNYGFYQITSITNYASGKASQNKVYVSSYYNSENSTNYTPYSGSGSNGLGSEYGYLTNAQTSSNDYFGGRYYEADVPSLTTIDLTGSSFSLSSTSLTAGNTVTAYFGIQNTGNGNAGSFNVKFYLSTDSTINTSDKYLSLYTISSLNSGLSTGTLSTNLTLPGATDSFWGGSKTYYIGMIVDADSSISESNEVNNSNTGIGRDGKDTYVTIPAASFVSISNLVFSGKEGDAGTFNLSLNQAITSNVTLTFNAGKFLTIDADGIVGDGTQNTITFTPTNWNQSRTVWFIAENDDTSSNRSSGNTIGYTLSGGLSNSSSYDLGTIINTYAPDYTRFNIDLDFRNDTQNFWTSARRIIAQRAASDWANVIANELNGVTLSSQRLGMVGVNGLDAFTFTTNRYMDDFVIFVGSYNGGDQAAGWGGSYSSLGGWTASEPLPRAGEFTVNALEAVSYSDADLYSIFCHEIGHALGLLGQDQTSANLIDKSTPQTAVFKGEYSRIANGGSYIPLQSQDGPNPVTGQYDYSHPADRVYSMMSYGYTYQLSAPTSIDFALLADAGYRVKGVNA
ncbi:MAG: pre-peptidase C-terminal domain-containing protein [Leptolyngbya sp. BL-A-14]